MGKLFARYDECALRQRLDDAGVLIALTAKGFHDFDVTIDDANAGLVRVQLFAHKGDGRHLLLDGCLTESIVRPEYFRARNYAMEASVRLASVYWLREQDPTASFTPGRPPLPLQRHPGLGVLRATFHVIADIARADNFDGIACVPKFFHDAVIFYRSRLFLFLDGSEQGRFEALLDAAGRRSLNLAAQQLMAGGVRDATGTVVVWNAGAQVCPLSLRLAGYLHSAQYVAQMRQAYDTSRFTWRDDSGPMRHSAAGPACRCSQPPVDSLHFLPRHRRGQQRNSPF
jgi:hypothetical protein